MNRILNLTAILISVGLITTTHPVFSQETHRFRPADNNSSRSRQQGGSRNASIFVPQQPPVTAITPEQGGVTIKEYPSFFVFVPQAVETTENLSAEFAITNEQDNVIYETITQLPQQASIIQIDLPQTEASTGLKVNQTYQWYFAVRSGLETVETVLGAIQRVEPTSELLQVSENTTMQQRLELYQQQGIWYETLSTLAEILEAEPNKLELISQWQKLLKSVGLEKIIKFPFAANLSNSSQSSESKKPDSSTRFRPADNSSPPQNVTPARPAPR